MGVPSFHSHEGGWWTRKVVPRPVLGAEQNVLGKGPWERQGKVTWLRTVNCPCGSTSMPLLLGSPQEALSDLMPSAQSLGPSQDICCQ